MIYKDDLIGNSSASIFNSNGHRCKELNKLNTKNYILFAGGDIGVDVNTPLENTYPYLISKKSKLDYYNLCVSSGGLDVLRFNLISWFNKYPLPKAVIINCEFLEGQIKSDPVYSYLNEADTTSKEIQDIYESGYNCNFFYSKKILANKLLSHLIPSFKYQIKRKNEDIFFFNKVINIKIEDDIFDHSLVAEAISDDLVQKLSKVKP